MNTLSPGVELPREAPLASPLVVEMRLMEGLVVKGILCRHGTGDAPTIARQLEETDVVAFEGPLNDEYMRTHDEANYTNMVSSPLSHDTYRSLRVSGGNQLHAILSYLVGKGPRTIRLIDSARGSEGWSEYQQSLMDLDSFRSGMNSFPRVQRARIARNRLPQAIKLEKILCLGNLKG